MLKLMQYEFRKTWFAKMMLLIVTAVAEVIFLIGCFRSEESLLIAIGVTFLIFVATFGIVCIGIDTLLVLNRDLNTKQGYMLFLVPRNSFQILGAKILENGLSIFLTGAFFLLLAAGDLELLFHKYGEAWSVANMLSNFLTNLSLHIEISYKGVAAFLGGTLCGWLSSVVAACFAIILSSTLFTGKKFNGFLSLVIYFGLNFLMGWVTHFVPYFHPYGYYAAGGLIYLAFAIVIYLGSCFLMDKKLSV